MIKSFNDFINEDDNKYICKFCGKECKNPNSLRNHERLCKENPNKDISSFVSHNEKIRNGERVAWNKGKTKENDEGIRNNIESRRLNIESGKTVPYWRGKHLSVEHKKKLSKAQTDFLIKNNLNRWSNAHSSNRTYPEIYFENIFKDLCVEQYVIEGLPYKIDFADVDNKIAIEVDGEQHYIGDEQVEHDKIRDKKLEEFGWRTIRIRWSSFQKLSNEEKELYIKNLFNIAGWSEEVPSHSHK